MRSLKSLLHQLQRDIGAQAAPVAERTDDELVRAALEQFRPDLLFFLAKVIRQGTVLVLEFKHPAAAQEASMLERELLAALERVAGSRVAGKIKCRAGGGG